MERQRLRLELLHTVSLLIGLSYLLFKLSYSVFKGFKIFLDHRHCGRGCRVE